MSADFASFMPEVAAILLGEPNARLSSKAELRYGNNGSLAIDIAAGTYFDHEAKEGGGVLDLIARQTGRKPNGPAVEWLKEQGFPIEEGRQASASAPARGKIVATYDYVDEEGTFLFQVVRFEPKTFRQRRKVRFDDPPDKVRDGWVWSVKGVRQVPYRLPELIEAIALERPIFIVEGEKDVDNVRKLGLNATCNAQGAGKWVEGMSAFFAGADVIHLPDNDDAGREHTAIVGAALAGVVARQRVLELPGLPSKGDVSDWIESGGTVELLNELVETRAEPWSAERQTLHFGAVWFADAENGIHEAEWLIDDLLTRGDMSLLYGPSKSGKSFLATHFSLAICRGVPVFERKVRQGGVVYIAAEGRKGFKKRLKAYRIENDIQSGTQLPFVLVPSAIDLFSKEGDIDKLLADLRLIEPRMTSLFKTTVELVVVDTYAAVSPGANENASEDVSRIVNNCKRIQEVLRNAHIMIVHHKNAAGDRPRGHSSLYAGIDNAIEVTCDEAKNRTARIDKMKDGEDGFSIGFRLQSVVLGARDDGKPITSCVVVPAQALDARTGKGPFVTNKEKIALLSLHEALISHGEPAPTMLKLPAGTRVVNVKFWKQEYLRRAFVDETPNESTFRMAFQRAGEALHAKRVIGRDQPYVWVVRDPST